MASTYALYVAVSFNGDLVEERSVRFGETVQIGNSATVAVPVPKGHDHLARVMWTSPQTAVVESVSGTVHEVTPGEDLNIEVGPVSLRLYLVEQFRIRRSSGVSSLASLAWFCVVLLTSLLFVQAEWISENHCFVSGHLLREYAHLNPGHLYCQPQQADGGAGGAFTAEYIARLLREDYDGEEQGVIETVDNIDRPDGQEIEDNHTFMPAGDEGPVTKMGGAEETSPEPVRSVDDEDIPLPQKAVDEKVDLSVENGTPVAEPADEVEPVEGQTEGLENVEREEEDDSAELTAEEEEGWGVPDWYDERDAAFEEWVLRNAIQNIKQRLRIDPDDVGALGVLSYYQYLAQDYDGAVDSYDRIIEQIPEDAAAYNNKALVYKRRGEYQKEEALYRIALSLSPMDEHAMNNLAVNLSHQGRFDEALAIMDQLMQMDPDDSYAHLHRAKIYAEMGDDEKSYFYLQKSLETFDTMDVLHRIEFRQDIRVDPSFARMRETHRFRSILAERFGKDVPLPPE